MGDALDSPTPAPAAPVAPPPAAPVAPAPLDQVSLSEYATRRNQGEAPGRPPSPAPAAPPEPETPAAPVFAAPGAEDVAERPAPAPAAEGEKKPKIHPVQARIDKLVKERSDALSLYHSTLAKQQALESELAQLKHGNGHAPPPPAPEADAGPTLDAFLSEGKSYEDWIDARIAFQARQIADSQISAQLQRVQQAAQQEEFAKARAGFHERTEAARAKYADYDTVVAENESVQLSPVMQDIALRSPQGADIMYWLGSHPQEANQLGEMTANYPPAAYPLVEQHLLLLVGAATRTGAPRVAPVSSAPAPISPVGGGTTTSSTPLDQVPLGEFIRRRNADEQRRRRP